MGACVGPKGSRVKMVVDELGGEKIDIVEYSDDIVTFIKNALSPARVLKVLTDEEKKFALIVVQEMKPADIGVELASCHLEKTLELVSKPPFFALACHFCVRCSLC